MIYIYKIYFYKCIIFRFYILDFRFYILDFKQEDYKSPILLLLNHNIIPGFV